MLNIYACVRARDWPYTSITTLGTKNMRMVSKAQIIILAIHPPWCQASRLSFWSFTPIIMRANVPKNKKFAMLTRRTPCIWNHWSVRSSEVFIPANQMINRFLSYSTIDQRKWRWSFISTRKFTNLAKHSTQSYSASAMIDQRNWRQPSISTRKFTNLANQSR